MDKMPRPAKNVYIEFLKDEAVVVTSEQSVLRLGARLAVALKYCDGRMIQAALAEIENTSASELEADIKELVKLGIVLDSNHLPALMDSIIVEAVGDELILFDQKTDQVHSLNASAALIARACGDQSSFAEVASQLSSELKISLDDSRDLVDSVVVELGNAGLVAEQAQSSKRVSRRKFLKKTGMAAAAFPVLASALAPRAAAAISCFDPCAANVATPTLAEQALCGRPCNVPGGCTDACSQRVVLTMIGPPTNFNSYSVDSSLLCRQTFQGADATTTLANISPCSNNAAFRFCLALSTLNSASLNCNPCGFAAGFTGGLDLCFNRSGVVAGGSCTCN